MRASTDRPTAATWSLLALPALVVLFGLQSLRTLLPLLVFVLRDRLDWSAVQVGIVALALFLTAFLAAPLFRWLGVRRLLAVAVYGLALMRVLLQLWRFDPIGDLLLAMLAVVCFLLFFAPYLALARANQSKTTGTVMLALLLGFALDSAVHGASGTLDLSWRDDLFSLLAVAAGALALVWLQRQLPRLLPRDNDSDAPWAVALSWIGFGAMLFLEMLILANLARLTQLSGWAQPAALAWLLVAQLVAIAAVTWLPRGWFDARQTTFLLAALLLLSLIEIWPTGWAAALQMLVGQTAAALLLQIIVYAILHGDYQNGLRRLSVGNGLAMLFFMLSTFLFYAGYDIALPIPNTVWPLLAGAILGLSASVMRPGLREPRRAPVWQAAAMGLVLLIVPLLLAITWQTPTLSAEWTGPVQIVNYNLHNGFDPDGRLSIERMAQTIEAQNPDAVMLQEVGRGWMIYGSVDMMAWLAQRLGMAYVYAPTAGPLWGNAILSRLPIVASEQHPLPTRDLLLRRGFVTAQIDVGEGESLELVNTHLHHPDDGSDVRVHQVQSLLDFLQDRTQFVLAGDLNAQPDSPEMQMLAAAGLRDALAEAGVAPGFTYPARDPAKRIDYIWTSPDLAASQVEVLTVDASDHLPISAAIVR